jgi:predicted nucleic acid-binding protein
MKLIWTDPSIEDLRAAASKAVKALRSRPNVTVMPQTSDQFERALGRYEERIDKDWSLTDCASFLIMEAEGIGVALTHDQHFAQAGFQTLLR